MSFQSKCRRRNGFVAGCETVALARRQLGFLIFGAMPRGGAPHFIKTDLAGRAIATSSHPAAKPLRERLSAP